jgi:DNA-binding transcriptional MerR regulator
MLGSSSLSLLSIMAEKKLTQIAFEFEDAPVTTANEPVSLTNTEVHKLKKQITSVAETIKTITPSKRGRKALKTSDENADLVQIPEDEILFQKQYYNIGDVAKMFHEKTSLIRYWETEFDILDPRKNRKGDRFFRPIDVKNLKLIYDLLRRRKMTIEGAKAYLKNASRAEEKYELIQSLEKIKGFLIEMKASL